MMKLIIVLCVVVATVYGGALPPSINYPQDGVYALKQESDNIGLGNYHYLYQLSDGTQQEQTGEVRNEGREDESIAIRGYYSWVAPNGVTYKVTYVADENGFNPEIEEGPGGPPPAVVASLLG